MTHNLFKYTQGRNGISTGATHLQRPQGLQFRPWFKKKKVDQLWQDLWNTPQGACTTHVHGMMPPRDKAEDRSIYGPTYTKKKNQTLQI